MLCVVTVVIRSTMTRSYRELRHLSTFEERFRYLSLKGVVGEETFGHDRYLNQRFYTSREWRRTRRDAIARDLGCDLGIEGYEINSGLLVHHINPVSYDDLINGASAVFDLNNLITTTHRTHNAIHYGDESILSSFGVQRTPGDTRLW